MAEFPYLSVFIWLPMIGGMLALALGRDDNEGIIRGMSLLFAGATLALCVPFLQHFEPTQGMQFVEHKRWLPSLDIHYALGADGLSVLLIVLTAFITLPVTLAALSSVKKNLSQYLAAFLMMEGLMNGVFAATDSVLFYVFWEAMLIPMFLIIGVWGGPNRIYATIKFFLYTFFGSVFMLVALIYLRQKALSLGVANTFAIETFQNLPLSLLEQQWIFWAFLLAFAVKVPMWPVHTWLPDAHVEAPTGGSVVLAAIMLKMGAYGFLRFILPVVPDGARYFQMMIIAMSLVAVVYIGLVALAQRDMKRLIAYSSIAHMGFVTLGFFVALMVITAGGENAYDVAIMGVQGGVIQMISHGFISGALFLCVGVLYDRIHSREIGDYGGVVNRMPIFASLFLLFALGNCGLPGTSGFVGEFMVILSAFSVNFWVAFLAATTLIFGAAYTLWMYKRVVFGEVGNARVAALEDINLYEKLVLGSLAIPVLIFGVWPKPMLDVVAPTAKHLVELMVRSKVGGGL